MIDESLAWCTFLSEYVNGTRVPGREEKLWDSQFSGG